MNLWFLFILDSGDGISNIIKSRSDNIKVTTEVLKHNIKRRIIETKIHTTHLHSPVIDGETVTLFDVTAGEGSPVPDFLISKAELPEKIMEALSLLKPRDEEIIRMRFGLNQEGAVHTLGDIGKNSASRASA